MGIFNKHQCISCAVWRRKAGPCPKCAAALKKREAFSIDYRDSSAGCGKKAYITGFMCG